MKTLSQIIKEELSFLKAKPKINESVIRCVNTGLLGVLSYSGNIGGTATGVMLHFSNPKVSNFVYQEQPEEERWVLENRSLEPWMVDEMFSIEELRKRLSTLEWTAPEARFQELHT